MDERGTIDGGRQAGGPDVASEDGSGSTAETAEGGRQVGLGRVVEELRSGDQDPNDRERRDAPPPDVTDTSDQSFPASDPPALPGAPIPDGTNDVPVPPAR